MHKVFSRVVYAVARVNRSYQGSGRPFRYPPFLGSSVVVGTYLGYLLLTDSEHPPEYYPNDLSATLVRRLPLNGVSRLISWIMECKIPVGMRPFVYGSYARLFDCDLTELKQTDLKAYPSLAEFFTRELAPSARPINSKAQLVSPSDGQILHFGPVDPIRGVLEQVKGVSYSLPEFFGLPNHRPTAKQHILRPLWPAKISTTDKQLYQCVIYLAPGDCHRFYNPTDWSVLTRRHFPGKLLSVKPRVVARLPGLYAMNERVVYLGRWAYGFMSLTAVGAVGVGGIDVSLDPTLVTNARADQPFRIQARAAESTTLPSYREREMPQGTHVFKGHEFGRFQFGSTIVLVFEAPVGCVSWPIEIGQHVKIGQALFEIDGIE
ncbi:unnamed protein product [Echinostoma caproni]|uniref:phosphatidylserine decarboxylase n=1 Tax=Echinostoma caproni TaxID=27848 RepID=A0A183AK68_9TREM|nr:unnamed protein product [Echinostoma caproni]